VNSAAATIFETTHNGGLAFLVVPYHDRRRRSDGAAMQNTRLHTTEVAGSNPAEPIVLFAVLMYRTVHWAFVEYENHGKKEYF